MSAKNRGTKTIANDAYPIPQRAGYSADASGRILSTKSGRVRVLGAWPNQDGYLRCNLWISGRGLSACVHVLVCTAWHGDRSSLAHEVRHLNGDPLDNRPSNLAWGTRRENAADRARHGNTAKGEHNGGGGRLTEYQVRSIKRELRQGAAQRLLATRYGVSHSMIGHIAVGRKWAHV